MKTQILLIVSAVLLTAGIAKANDGMPLPVSQKIKKALTYPNHALENNLQGNVWMEITAAESGTLEVQAINCADSALKEIVRKGIEKMDAGKIGLNNGETVRLKLYLLLRE